jgi:AraC family transcriptional regulator, transcriptional activator of pobA
VAKRIIHIPTINTIKELYGYIGMGTAQSDEIAIQKMEEQPKDIKLFVPLFKANFYKIVLFTGSGVQFKIVDEEYTSTAHSMYFAHPGKLESWHRKQKIKGYIICFTAEYIGLDNVKSSFQNEYPFFYNSETFIKISKQASDTLVPIINEMYAELESSNIDKHEIIKNLLHQYILKIRRIYTQISAKQTVTVQNNKSIYNRFIKELEQYFLCLNKGNECTQPTVSKLASKLLLSASYLNKVVKSVSSKTASQIIQDKTILESKSYLIQTDLQIAEIAYKLGFENIPYFIRLFKKATKQTPKEFRNIEAQKYK